MHSETSTLGVKKILTKILLISVILLGFGNISQTNADELDELNSIFSIEKEFSCNEINKDIKDYSKYKGIIDRFFRKISTKSYTYKKNMYTKLDILTTRKLTKVNKYTQAKIYTIIGYIKCESQKNLDKFGLEKEGNTYGKKGVFIREEGGIEIRKVFSKDKYSKTPFISYFYDRYGKLLYESYGLNKYEKIYISNNERKDEVIIITFDTGSFKKYIAFINKSKTNLKIETEVGNISILSSDDKIFLLNKDNKFLNQTNFQFTDYNVYDNKFIMLTGDYYGDSLYFVTNNSVKKVKLDNIDSIDGNTITGNFNGAKKKYEFDYLGNFTELKLKKGEFVKYIGAGVEARQNELYTYFYYNGELINTVKNKIKNDKNLIYGYNSNDDDFIGDKYLSSYYAKKKLDLYSAYLEADNNKIFFVKKIDNGQVYFSYDLKTGKMED